MTAKRTVYARRATRCAFWLVFSGFLVAIGATYAIPLWYQAHGERIILITGMSDSSDFSTGDAIVMEQVVDPSQLRIGQVVTFTYQNEVTGAPVLLTHRIIGFVSLPETTADGRPTIDPATGLGRTIRYIRTQGASNGRPDAQLTEITKIRGVVIRVRRHWGSWLTWARTPLGEVTLFVPPLGMLLSAELLSWRNSRLVLRRRHQPARRRSTDDALV